MGFPTLSVKIGSVVYVATGQRGEGVAAGSTPVCRTGVFFHRLHNSFLILQYGRFVRENGSPCFYE